MVESAGKKLQQARLRKQISVEEAARVTRMRPDKILDLEEDNYSNFPSMSYAKGFLLIYAKFLGVDIRDFTDTLQSPNPVSSGGDYEYLTAAASLPAAAPTRRPYSHSFAPRRERSILPLIVFGVLILLVILGYYLFSQSQRLGPLPAEDGSDKKEGLPAASVAPAISTLPPPATPAPSAPAPAPVVAATPAPAASPAVVPFAVPPPAPAYNPSLEVRRAVPVGASSPAASPGAPSLITPPLGAVKDITVKPLRKTRVTIHKDVAGSAPVFEDWLYPTDGPLKLRGSKFWIQVQDPGSVQVTEDGKPVPSGQGEIRIE